MTVEVRPLRSFEVRLSRRRAVALASLASAFLIRPVIASSACLPPEVFAPSFIGNSLGGLKEPKPVAPLMTVFLDVSGSMAGYVARPRPAVPGRQTAPGRSVTPPRPSELGEPRTFYDLVQTLPQLSASVADKTAFFTFGRSIKPLPLADLGRATRPEFYGDPDSRIQDALARMDELSPDTLGLLVTDLFLTGEEIFGGAAAIRAPLARVLGSGRSVGLVGIRSGFSGTIYDIPIVKTYGGAVERPFYLLITGPGAVVARFIRLLETELLSPLATASDGQPRHHATLFTHKPFSSIPIPLVVATPEGGAAAEGPAHALDVGSDVPFLRFSGAAGRASATIPVRQFSEGPALVPDQFRVEEQLFFQRPHGGSRGDACIDRWVEVRSLPKLAQIDTNSDGTPVLTVGGANLSRITPGVTFFLRSRVSVTGLSEMPRQTAWARSWNLEAREAESYVASQPKMFRTLNLREIVTMLEGTVRDQIVPYVLGESLLAFEVPKR